MFNPSPYRRHHHPSWVLYFLQLLSFLEELVQLLEHLNECKMVVMVMITLLDFAK